ncbi:hypothetical protein JAAARDRAFT_500862 [Jaapia argillacea MUCL 33604]|uniref:Uncharacterized protein n=1 Tax=Jaapia argillacea MUCL 33604 TaxID=933084 RepID=A0A067P9P9_9AGAM|nr:hypothetical protein JAAARDRAFT_500862 [Jaapia argillacea MUCL 33604]
MIFAACRSCNWEMAETIANKAQWTTSAVDSIFIAQMYHHCTTYHPRPCRIPFLSAYGWKAEGGDLINNSALPSRHTLHATEKAVVVATAIFIEESYGVPEVRG